MRTVATCSFALLTATGACELRANSAARGLEAEADAEADAAAIADADADADAGANAVADADADAEAPAEESAGSHALPTVTPAPLTDADCQGCHVKAAEQWARSRHHSAFTNPDFSRSYAREPKTFCRDCHAPALARPDATRLGIASAQDLGVGCLDCHIDSARPSVVLTGPSIGGCGAGTCVGPHEVKVQRGFGTTSCAPCHEFDFPEESRRPPGTMMQTTMREHAGSAFSDIECATCHLPPPNAEPPAVRDHSLSSSRDPQTIRSALHIRAYRDADSLVLELVPHNVGHAFPTGDLFRRLKISAIRTRGSTPIASTQRYLDRDFPAWRFRNGTVNPAWRRPVDDNRVRGPMVITLDLSSGPGPSHQNPRDEPNGAGPGDGTTISWQVDYQRIDHRDDLEPANSTIASEVRLAKGEL